MKMSAYLVFFCLLVVSCSNSDELGPIRKFRDYQSMRVDGRTRTFLLNLPPEYYSGAGHFPLVIAMHGTGGDAYQFEHDYAFTKLANDKEFVVAYPEGVRGNGLLGIRTWNAGYCCDYASKNDVDDVKFIRELIDQLIDRYHIDPKRVYLTGMSNGGMMAYRMACEVSNLIAAIATVSCSMVTGQDISPSQPMPVLHLHSELDVKVPYEGGIGLGGYYFPPIDSVLNVWSVANGCTSGPQLLVDNEDYLLTEWENCANNVVIQYYLTKDGGHAWPGAVKSRPAADEPSSAIDANELIWDFFQRYELP
jgi:polyhydroxybutyrate depolymerase